MIYETIKPNPFGSVPTSVFSGPSAVGCWVGFDGNTSNYATNSRVAMKMTGIGYNGLFSSELLAKVSKVVDIYGDGFINGTTITLNYNYGDIFVDESMLTASSYNINVPSYVPLGKSVCMFIYVREGQTYYFGGEVIINTTTGNSPAGYYCATFANIGSGSGIACISVWRTPGLFQD